MSYAERRIMLHEDFEKMLQQNWPIGTPNDCTKMHGESDCLDRVDPEPCQSCQAYDRLANEFDQKTAQSINGGFFL